ncbi:MAG: response regulator [Phototrophicaceae bacterium]
MGLFDQNRTQPLVLVVDDEQITVTMLTHLLEREQLQVASANDGFSALEKAARLLPDLILLDVQMPGIDGFEVLVRLRQNPMTMDIPTIILSARARQPADIAKGLNIGADDYMSKPFAPQELIARVHSKLRARQLEVALQQRTQELEALLRVGELLNQQVEVSEIFSLLLLFTQDLLRSGFTMICKMTDQQQIALLASSYPKAPEQSESLAYQLIVALPPLDHIWRNSIETTLPNFPAVIIFPLQHGANELGFIVVAFDEQVPSVSELRLFRGILRQAALSLYNAELYQVQANYALHLEDMVAERTIDLQKTQEMLFRSEKLASIGHLAASIAHEINNPLQPIQLNLEFISDEIMQGNPIDLTMVKMTQDSVERISRIVRQLLEFTHHQKSSTTFAPQNLCNILNAMIRLNQKSLERQKVEVAAKFPIQVVISGNRDQLEQVFMNMLLNAQDAMPQGGELRVTIWEDSDHAYVRFNDNGIGIPAQVLPKIFDPFVSTKPDGTGLGLFVSYGIVENHHGRIDVESQEGFGTTFTLTFPRYN